LYTERDVIITDAQVHIWKANTPERPWLAGQEAHRSKPLEVDELLREMDAAGVSRVVIVPPTLDADRNDLALDAARRYPDRFAVMGRLNLELPGAREKIAAWRQQKGMLGLRFSFQRPWLTPMIKERRVDWLWQEAEKAGVPIMLLTTHDMVYLIDEVAERYPGLKIVLDHLALPSGKKDDEAFRDIGKLLAVARRPNIAVKASTLPLYTNDAFPFRCLHPYVRQVYDSFGPQRMFWGSDLSRLNCPYSQCVKLFTEELPWLKGDDLASVMGRGLSEWIGWK
jgi:predicted TIM-barrel fold metal-dependent hydrolase